MDLLQAADIVTGTWRDAVDQGDRTDQQKLTVSDLSGQMRGSVLEGELKAALAGGPPLKQHFRWTVLNDEFKQFQGIEFAMKAETDDRLQVLFAADNCGSRQGTPLPTPCRELSGLVIDSFRDRGVDRHRPLGCPRQCPDEERRSRARPLPSDHFRDG